MFCDLSCILGERDESKEEMKVSLSLESGTDEEEQLIKAPAMSVEIGGAETLVGKEVKHLKVQYCSNGQECNCSFSLRTGAPCRHILLVRQKKKLPLFHLSLFNPRFWKDREADLYQNNFVPAEDIQSNIKHCVNDPEDVKIKVLNKGEKYRILGPLTERFLDATLRNGSKKIGLYREEFETLIKHAKNGQSLLARDQENFRIQDEFHAESLESERTYSMLRMKKKILLIRQVEDLTSIGMQRVMQERSEDQRTQRSNL